MTLAEFHNGLRLLRSIDLHELQAVGLWTKAERDATDYSEARDQWLEWRSFQTDPYLRMIKCDDETAAKIWAAMERRMKPLGTPISQLSGRPGHPGFDKYSAIARSWGYD